MRPRTWLRRASWAAAAALVAGCSVGHVDAGRLVGEPGGLRIRLAWNAEYAGGAFGYDGAVEFFGEALAMQEDGLLLWRDLTSTPLPPEMDPALLLVASPVLRAASIRVSRPDRSSRAVGKRLHLDDPDDHELLTGWTRYPGPVDAATVDALMQAHGLPHLVVLTEGGVLTRSPGGGPPDLEARHAFLAEARAAADGFADLAQAIGSGYRRLGPDFPAMGEHWIHPARLLAGQVVASEPPILTYTRMDGEKVLTGVAYAVPLAPGETPPPTPLGDAIWHDHANTLDEEMLLLDSPATHAAGTDTGARVAMFHVWSHLENPAGMVAQNNWALPFARVGLPVPEPLDPRTARAVSLVGAGRDYYRRLITRAAAAEGPDHELIRQEVTAASRRVEALVAQRETLEAQDRDRLARLWTELWTHLQRGLSPAAWRRLEPAAHMWSGMDGSHH